MDSNLTIYGYNNDNRWLVVGQEKKFLCRSLMCSILKDYTSKRICMPWRMYKHTFDAIKWRKKTMIDNLLNHILGV